MRGNNWKVKRDLAVYNEDVWEHLWRSEFVFRYLRTLNVLLFYSLPYLMTVKLCGLWDSFIKHAYKQLHLLKQVYFTIPVNWLTTTLKYIKLSYACIRFPNRYLIQLFVVPSYDRNMRKGDTSFCSYCSRPVNNSRIDYVNLVVYCGMFSNISYMLMKIIFGYNSVFRNRRWW